MVNGIECEPNLNVKWQGIDEECQRIEKRMVSEKQKRMAVKKKIRMRRSC